MEGTLLRHEPPRYAVQHRAFAIDSTNFKQPISYRKSAGNVVLFKKLLIIDLHKKKTAKMFAALK